MSYERRRIIWLAGDLPARNWMEHRERTRQGVRTGAAVGSLVGLLVLALRRRPGKIAAVNDAGGGYE
jgi:hypothetical protein